VSYILDALKKAEMERRRGTLPDVTAVQGITPAKGRGMRSVWVYLLLAALFLNAAVAAFWLRPWNAERPGRALQTAKGEKVTNTAKSADLLDAGATVVHAPAGQADADVAGGTVTDRRGEKLLPPKEVETTGELSRQSEAADAGVERSFSGGPGTASEVKEERGVATAALPPPAANRIYALNRLPSSVRQGLPDLTMSLHYFTVNPSSRLISINGKTLKEGQELIPGLRLEKITVAGAILDYHGYRFSIGMQSR